MVENPVYTSLLISLVVAMIWAVLGSRPFLEEPEPLKNIQGAGNGVVNLFRGSREPEPVKKTPKNDFQESSGSRAFLEGLGAGFFYIKNSSQEPGLF